MNSNELLDKFLKRCRNYETFLNSIILKNQDNVFKVYTPENAEEKDFLIYEVRKGKWRITSFTSDIDELLELCTDTVGEDSIISESKYKYY